MVEEVLTIADSAQTMTWEEVINKITGVYPTFEDYDLSTISDSAEVSSP